MNPAHVKRVRLYAAAGEQHIRHAAKHGLTVQGLVKGFIQPGKLLGIVGQVVLHQRRSRRHQRFLQGFRFRFAVRRPIAVPERFHHVRHGFRRDLPQRHGPGEQGFVGVRDVEVVFQPGLGGAAVEHGDARAPRVHPAAKQLVPSFQFEDGGGAGPLGVDKHLLVEGEFIVPGGGPQKGRPFGGGLRDVFKLMVVCVLDDLQLACHQRSSLSLDLRWGGSSAGASGITRCGSSRTSPLRWTATRAI